MLSYIHGRVLDCIINATAERYVFIDEGRCCSYDRSVGVCQLLCNGRFIWAASFNSLSYSYSKSDVCRSCGWYKLRFCFSSPPYPSSFPFPFSSYPSSVPPPPYPPPASPHLPPLSSSSSSSSSSSLAHERSAGQCRLILEVSRSHSDTSQSLGLLRTSDRLVADTSV